jgi:tetrapyrrole methylase family protein/MazG family protein
MASDGKLERALRTSARSVVVVGLGPGAWDDLTLAARAVLEHAPRVVCRTTRHPTVDALRAQRPEMAIESFDPLYDGAQSFEALYETMARELVARAEVPLPRPLRATGGLPYTAARGNARAQAVQGVGVAAADGGEDADEAAVVYAVPGHPLIGEESVRRLRALAAERGVEVRVVPGLSFVEPVCAALGLDPLDRHLQLLDATLLAEMDAEAVMGAVQPTSPALVAQLYNRRLASGVKLALGEMYPDDWPVTVVRSAGMPGAEVVEGLPLYELDRGERADHLTTLYVPPLDRLEALRVPEGLRYVVQRLRAPDGCPWDREQTHQTLRKYVLEEAYEVAEVLDEWDDSPETAEHLAEELGDLLLQVYLQAEVANGEGHFHIGDVYEAITAKLIRRHPHVFGDVTVRDAAHVVQNWETLKRKEREAQGQDVAAESELRGIPRSAPALYQAQELSRKAARVGFDWPDVDGTLAKVAEEAREIADARAAGEREQVQAELGDLLFAVASLARRLEVAPEDALQSANMRFRTRFERMEARASTEGRDLHSLTLDEWIAWWDAAKRG